MSIVLAAVGALAQGLPVPLAAQPGPCDQVKAACKNAGFTQGGASTGTGLQADCIKPIMQGIAQPAAATQPLPHVDPQVVAACKARHPDFGQGQVSRSAAGTQSARVAQPLTTPGAPSVSGSVVTSANGIPAAAGSLTAGAGSVQSGIPSGQGVQPDVKKAPNTATSAPTSDKSHGSWPMACLIGPQGVAGGVAVLGSTALLGIESTISTGSTLGYGNGTRGWQANECAFEDRALREWEPTNLCFDASIGHIAVWNKNRYISKSVGSKGGHSILITEAGGVQFNGPGAAALNSAINGPNQLYTLVVHKGQVDGFGFYEAQVGPTPCWIVDEFRPFNTQLRPPTPRVQAPR